MEEGNPSLSASVLSTAMTTLTASTANFLAGTSPPKASANSTSFGNDSWTHNHHSSNASISANSAAAAPKRRASSLLMGLGLFNPHQQPSHAPLNSHHNYQQQSSAPPRSSNQRRTNSAFVSQSAAAVQATRLKSDMLSLLGSAVSSDVLIVVGSDRVEFKAHRLILATRSDFFRNEFFSAGNQSGNVIIEMPLLDPDAFRIILRFLYTAEEDDEATSPTTNDWRLVLACFQACLHISLNERAQVYQRVFVALFQACDAAVPESLDDARDMWTSAISMGLEDLLVACAPAFWVVFGAQNSSVNICSSGGKHLLVDVPLDTLIRIINAIPDNLESAVGRFRLIKLWIMSQPAQFLLEDEEEDNGFVVGKHYDNLILDMEDEQDLLASPPSTPLMTQASFEASAARDGGDLQDRARSRRASQSVGQAITKRQLSASPARGSIRSPHTPSASPPQQHIKQQPSQQQRLRSQQYQQQLLSLNLDGLTGAQILREVEPSNILCASHVLNLYRAAAANSGGGGGAAAATWTPVPCGFKGRRPSSWNSRTKWVTVGGSSGNSLLGTNVTYCTVEALGMGVVGGSGGKYVWTVMPLHNVGNVGIGVSADVGVSGGATAGSGEDIMERLESGVSSLFGTAQSSSSRRGSVIGGDVHESAGFGGTSAPGSALTPGRFVGEDGGWSLWSDGTLRVGRIFVGRLPAGITFNRGSQITVKLDLDARTLGFDVNGVDCGIAFRNLPAVLYPSVAIGDAASVSISPIKRVF
ncbi:hypothetical protein HDU81_006115 [Chytriomyces hyalinus]|nr:hypothetical protein HDU81_006115 [Chytriomyces hyalinus]